MIKYLLTCIFLSCLAEKNVVCVWNMAWLRKLEADPSMMKSPACLRWQRRANYPCPLPLSSAGERRSHTTPSHTPTHKQKQVYMHVYAHNSHYRLLCMFVPIWQTKYNLTHSDSELELFIPKPSHRRTARHSTRPLLITRRGGASLSSVLPQQRFVKINWICCY